MRDAARNALRDDTLIIVNDNSIDSPQIGRYYAQQRGINPANIVHIKVPDSVFINWDDFRSLRDQIIRFMQTRMQTRMQDRMEQDELNLTPLLCSDGEPPYYCPAAMDQLRAHSRIRYLVTTRGVPTRMMVAGSTLSFASAPTSVDNYLKYWLLNYFPDDVKLDFPQREIAFGNGDSMRTIIPAVDRELIVGRIDGLNLKSAMAQIDRTVNAENTGIYGRWYGSTKFWRWQNKGAGGMRIYPALGSILSGWRYGLGQWREERRECVDYLSFSGFSAQGKAPAYCRIQFNDDFNPATQTTLGIAYPAPGNSRSRLPRVVDALGYQGWLDGQATLGSFDALLNWRKNDQCSVTLCKDSPDPVACKARSTDIFSELNTDCVGVAEGFMAYNHSSYPVSYLAVWPTGWSGPASGDVFQLAFPEVRTDSGFDDNYSLWFRNTDQVANPLCYSASDFTVPASRPCKAMRRLQLRQRIQLAATPIDVNNTDVNSPDINNPDINNSVTYQVSLNYQTRAFDALTLNTSTPLRVRLLVRETGAGSTTIDYGLKTLANMAAGDSGWRAASVQFTLDPARHSANSYDRIELVFDTANTFSGELGIDVVSVVQLNMIQRDMVQRGIGTELLLNGSFADGHRTVSAGDHAANFLNRLNGVAVWGSVGHHQSGGCAFCFNGLEIMAYFLRGLPLGDAVWFDESNNSGILYGDPLYSPVAVRLNPPDRRALQKGSVDLYGSTVNGRDPLQVNTSYRVDICAAGDFYVCDQAQSWQATAIRGVGGRENMLLGTLDTSSFVVADNVAADFVLRLQVDSVNSRTGKSQRFADYYSVTVKHTAPVTSDAPVVTDSRLSVVEDVSSADFKTRLPLTSKVTTSELTDANKNDLRYRIVRAPSYGRVELDGDTGDYVYIPDADANGIDSFTFKVSDGERDSNTALVTISISAVNDAPLAMDAALDVVSDTSSSGMLTASDVDNDPLTYRIVSNASKGSVIITDANTGEYRYSPDSNASGVDSFSFIVSDGQTNSEPAVITVQLLRAAGDGASQGSGSGSGISLNLIIVLLLSLLFRLRCLHRSSE